MSFPLELKTFHLLGQPVEIFVPQTNAVREIYLRGNIPFPYWSQAWPASLALSEFLLLHKEYIQQKKVIELGAGLGLPSIIAASYAHSVLCSDYISEAVGIASQSAAHNGLNNFTAQVLDWHSLPHNLSADVLLLSDINYDPAIFSVQQQLINHFIKTGTIVILSTPQRLMAKEFVAPLMSFCKQQEEISVSHHGNVMRITILVLGKE
jgi:predicted nicotinamide N-methyase